MTTARVGPAERPIRRPEGGPRLLAAQGFLPSELLERWHRRCERAKLPGPDGEWANELLIFSLSPERQPHDVEPVTGETRRSTIAGFLETRDFTGEKAFIDEAQGVDVLSPKHIGSPRG